MKRKRNRSKQVKAASKAVSVETQEDESILSSLDTPTWLPKVDNLTEEDLEAINRSDSEPESAVKFYYSDDVECSSGIPDKTKEAVSKLVKKRPQLMKYMDTSVKKAKRSKKSANENIKPTEKPTKVGKPKTVPRIKKMIEKKKDTKKNELSKAHEDSPYQGAMTRLRSRTIFKFE